jgi:hypothetical protein
MRKLLPVLLTFLFLSTASAEIYHELEIEDGYIDANTSIELESEDKVGYWNLEFKIPRDSKIERITDSIGQIDDYSLDGREISLTTNKGDPRGSEYLQINYKINRPPEEPVKGLKTYRLRFSGFKNTTTSGTVTEENLISGRVNHGFHTSYNESSMAFEGIGPVILNLNFGKGRKSKYFTYFGEGDRIENDSLAYEIALGTVGHQQSFEKYPVGFSKDFQGSEWIAGEYQNGRILMRPQNKTIRPILTHEIVHGLNNQLLNWDKTDSTWFDEGVASHAESLMLAKIRGYDRTPNLFGDDVTYTENGKIYSLGSKGDRDNLWNYYQNDLKFMKEWSAKEGNREFGYAYSELIIKNHLRNNNSIREIYSEVNPEGTVEDEEKKWNIYSKYLELKPCDYENRKKFEECLQNINDYEYKVETAEPVEKGENLDIQRVKVPERDHLNQSLLSFSKISHSTHSLMDTISEFISGVLSWMIKE